MNHDNSYRGRNDYLQRLPPENYQGQAYVHWTMTIDDRRTGWLIPIFYYKFREILTHTLFRYGLVCPIYCLMPDHIHMVWIGIYPQSDQRLASRYFRRQLNPILEKLGAHFQQQPYDHVLTDEERERAAFENSVEYVARNPERAGLVELDRFRDYPFTGTLSPGYPEMTLWEADSWIRFWRTYAYLRDRGLMRTPDEDAQT